MNKIAVIGAGFSGISVCYHLLQHGIIPIVFDAGLPEKASSVPLGLINPATGQKALPAWNYDEALQVSFSFLEDLQNFSNQPIYKQNGVIRPAMNESMAEAFQKNSTLFNGDVTFLNTNEFAREYPSVFSEFGGLVIHRAGTVSGSKIHQAFTAFARHHQIDILHEKVEFIENQSHAVKVKTNQKNYLFDVVFICTGSVLPVIQSLSINSLIHPVKGQLSRLKLINSITLPETSISGLGYLARLDNEFVFGSTFEHHFEHLNPTEGGAHRLQEQLEKLIPNAKNLFVLGRQWVGVRASTPDRKPLLGSFDEHQNIYFYLGNGSKGMLWSVLLGKMLVEQFQQKNSIPNEVDIRRFAHKFR